MEESKLSAECRSEVRKLANKLWDKELESELLELRKLLESMERREISATQVAESIHEFHDGIYRKLIEINQTHEPVLLLGRAIVKGLAREEEIPQEARPLVKKAIIFYRTKTSSFDKRSSAIDEP